QLVSVDDAAAHPLAVRKDGQLVDPLNSVIAPAVGDAGVTDATAVGVSASAGGADVTGCSVNDTCGVASGPLNELDPVVPMIVPRIVTTVGAVLVAVGGL